MTNDAARGAIRAHIRESVKGNGKALRVAFLTHEVMDTLCLEIANDFVTRLRKRLEELDTDMTLLVGPPKNRGTSLTYGDPCNQILWRHPEWPEGAGVCLEFESKGLCGAYGGFYAISQKSFDELPDKWKKGYTPVEDKNRQRIREAIDNIPKGSAFRKEMSLYYWPSWNWMEEPLNDWATAEALPIVDGSARFDFRGTEYDLDKWLADEFMKIREAVKPVLRY